MDEGLVRNFPPTRHSALTALRSSDSVERARGLETLCSVYWRPVYGYLRLHWRFPHDQAADLTQEFFAVLLEKELLQRFDPSRARLRTWLRACVDGVVSSVDRAAARQKRGGGAVHLDWEEARGEIEGLADRSPEEAFDEAWARGVFAVALQRLRAECEGSGRQQQFELLAQCDLTDQRPSYAALAEQFGLSVTDVTNRLFRARRELRRVVMDLLRELTSSDEELREQARGLLQRGPG